MKIGQSCVETPTRKEVKCLPQKPTHGAEDATERQDESRYVDLETVDAKTGGTKAAEESGLGQRNQTSVLINNSGAEVLCVMEPDQDTALETGAEKSRKDDEKHGQCREDVPVSSPDSPRVDPKSEDCPKSGDKGERALTQQEVSEEQENKQTSGQDEDCSDNYLSRGSESEDFEEDDDVSLVLFDECVMEDESHYITTHEIQLSELSDHEGDYDLGVGSSASWDIEDDNQVYSFVDYAFDGDGAARGGGAAVSTLLESDLCDAAKFTSSDESVSKSQQQFSGNSGGQIHLSISTTSRAINDPSNIQEKENIFYHARRSGDMSRYVFRGVEGKAETLCDGAKCFVAAPGRLHFGGKLRGKEVTEYSSGTSSAVSELDDADKEVRNLTARAFKSLAYPYFDAINFSTSSESSASEHGIGINRWSTFVDLQYGNMNMSQGLDKRVVSHQNSTASFEIAKNIDNRNYKGIALASIKPPSKIFTLNGNPNSASSSTKKIELMGKFGQGHSGVIRLTETLNFRCNVKSGMSGGERPPNFAKNAAGSRSTYEVTNTLPSSQRGASKQPCKSMEDTHKKAIFASSVIKNVISKKMQFEQERKMERGEISEPHQTPPPSFVQQDSDSHRGKGSRELRRQSSKFSESGSDYAIMCLDELGDIVDSGSCDTKSDSRRRDSASIAPETNLDPANEAGIDTKKGALEASKSTLLRSQNSAFRCWKDEELEFQKDRKNDQTADEKQPSASDKEGDLCASGSGKLTKMSHLFVPSIQLLPSEGEVGQQLQSTKYSDCENGDIKLRADNTLYVADSRNVTTSKSPEIKINLRSIRDNKTEPFNVSKLRAPNIGCNTANLIRTDDFKTQGLAAALKGECSDKVPHFMVRDIRDNNNKGKLQTPIYQVRDVRKLVKSSYHFVSLDNNENKSSLSTADSHSELKKQMPYRNSTSVSPIVIKCQSVNTNSNGKQAENLSDLSKCEVFDIDRSSPEGAKSAPLQRAAGRAPLGNSVNSEGGSGLKIESRIASRRPEKLPDITDKKPESKMANQAAYEKLQAAVKTMEQLYVFEKNEWKRKNEPHPMTDSHVLSLITSEEQGATEDEQGTTSVDKTVRRDIAKTAAAASESPSNDRELRQEDKDHSKVLQTPSSHDDRLIVKSMKAASSASSKNTLSLSSSFNASASAPTKNLQPSTVTAPFVTKNLTPKSPKLPVSLKIRQTKLSAYDGAESKEDERSVQELWSSSADHENYLTIPVKSQQTNKQTLSAEKTSVYSFHTPPASVGSGTRGQEDSKPDQSPKRSSIVMETRIPETPSAAIYHTVPLSANHQQVYCFSPAITPAPTLDPFQATQRKMLLDPTTGNYYLVDTPIQPATKRLFDPETGQYVDVPMPQPPMTPVPMQVSPLALSPAAYGHTYMIYPGFMPTPSVIPARTLIQSRMSVQSEPESGEKVSSQQTEGLYMESPFYMATGKCPQASGTQSQATASRMPQGFSSVKQPVISVTSQQGPRIIAPPSFDGTTMSFVVEHR